MASQYSSKAGWNSGVWYSAMATGYRRDRRQVEGQVICRLRSASSGLVLVACSGGWPHTSTGRCG